MNTYTKLKQGDWGVKVEGEKPRAGQSVTVQTKAGQAKSEVIKSIIWSGKDKYTNKDVHLCLVEAKRQNRGYRAPSGTYAPGGRKCPNCGARDCSGAWGDGLCDED